MMEWLTLKWSATLLWLKPPLCLPTPSGNASAITHKTSTVDITSSLCSIWLVTWSFGVDYSHTETGPLVWWKSFFVTPGSMWPSVVVHEHWPVSQRMIVEMGDYAWSEHIVTVFLLLSYRSGNSSPKNGLGILCGAWRGVLQNFTINAVDILVIDFTICISAIIY
jgi:hypothetical protein